MNKETISDRQGISLVTIFIIGSSSIFVMGLEAKQDIWIAIILAIIMALPVVIIYARLHHIFINKNLYEICEIVFGKFLGKVFVLFFTLYTLDVTALNLRDYGQFFQTVAIEETPIIVTMAFYTILSVYGAKKGIEVLGRWSKFFVRIPITLIVVTFLLLIPKININNLRPILHDGIKPIIRGAFEVFSFPLAYTVGYTMVFSSFKTKKSPYRIYVMGLFIGGALLFITSVMGVLVIGADMAAKEYYPNYIAIKRIDVGEVIQRVEILSGVIFMLGGFIEICIYLMACCKGISKLLGFSDYRFIVVPMALLSLNLSYFEFDSIMQYYEWSFETWPYYSFFFQVILPVVILIAAEIKIRKIPVNKFMKI